MEDMIIKGTGNSRWLKSVANIMTLYPTYESFAEALAAGTFPIDLNGINPAGVQTSGTRLNKANLLTDALCTALGLATTATPTQAMDKLRQLVNTAQIGVNNGVKLSTGTYYGNGSSTKYLEFGFIPKFLIISNRGKGLQVSSSSNSYEILTYSAVWYTGLTNVECFSMIDNRYYSYYNVTFSVSSTNVNISQAKYSGDGGVNYPLTSSGITYAYIAIG